MVDIGAYRSGSNPELDRVIKMMPPVDAFLCQPFDESITRETAMHALRQLVRPEDRAA
jgi:flagellum-specific ATP synthase